MSRPHSSALCAGVQSHVKCALPSLGDFPMLPKHVPAFRDAAASHSSHFWSAPQHATCCFAGRINPFLLLGFCPFWETACGRFPWRGSQRREHSFGAGLSLSEILDSLWDDPWIWMSKENVACMLGQSLAPPLTFLAYFGVGETHGGKSDARS